MLVSNNQLEMVMEETTPNENEYASMKVILMKWLTLWIFMIVN